MSNKDVKIHINYDNILDIALKGIRRSYAFMGLGVNTSLDPEFKQYSLTGISQIQLIPDNLSDEAIEDVKKHFLIWIVGCGLRELIETFGVFLDYVFHASNQIAVSCENYDKETAGKDVKKFSRNGISDKLKKLENNFNITPNHSVYIESINKARNCITHRRGIVGHEDFNDDKFLKIKWIGIDLIAKTSKGEEILLDFTSNQEGIVIDGGEGGNTIGMKSVERELVYAHGALVDISAKSLAEICFFMTGESKKIIRSATDYAKRVGVPINT